MKKIIGFLIIIVLIIIFLVGNYSASLYGKQLISVLVHKLPYRLELNKVDAKYAIYDTRTELAVVLPEEKFTLDKTIFVQEIEKICEYENFLAIQIRTNENFIKILIIWEENDLLKAKAYEVDEFYSNNSELVSCVGLEHTPYIIKIWKIIGVIIITLILVVVKMFYLKKTQN